MGEHVQHGLLGSHPGGEHSEPFGALDRVSQRGALEGAGGLIASRCGLGVVTERPEHGRGRGCGGHLIQAGADQGDLAGQVVDRGRLGAGGGVLDSSGGGCGGVVHGVFPSIMVVVVVVVAVFVDGCARVRREGHEGGLDDRGAGPAPRFGAVLVLGDLAGGGRGAESDRAAGQHAGSHELPRFVPGGGAGDDGGPLTAVGRVLEGREAADGVLVLQAQQHALSVVIGGDGAGREGLAHSPPDVCLDSVGDDGHRDGALTVPTVGVAGQCRGAIQDVVTHCSAPSIRAGLAGSRWRAPR